MKSIKLASLYFLLAYIIGTIISFAAYYLKLTKFWGALFVVIALIFGYLFYLYLKKTKCGAENSLKETSLLIAFWILVSLLLDGIIYIVVIPLMYNYNSRWIFFTEQPLWFFVDYIMIIIVGYISRYIYIRLSNKSQRLR
jgi:hypothetical protein